MKDQQPVIIIKKKKGGHAAHHGGAWKVAYADFVTAMMAFFMVMWLVVLVVAYRLRRSRFGFQLIAVRDDEVIVRPTVNMVPAGSAEDRVGTRGEDGELLPFEVEVDLAADALADPVWLVD